MHKVRVLIDKFAIKQLVLLVAAKKYLVIWIKVNRYKAWMLWDLSSTTSGLTLSFAHVAGIKVALLVTLIMLELGMINSHSIVNYNTHITIRISGEYCNIYIDMENI